MALFRRGEIWWMSFSCQGKQIRRSTETADKKMAQRIFDKIKGEIAEGKWFERLPGEDYTYQEMKDNYLEEYSARKGSSDRDQVSLKHLLPIFGEKIETQITPREISQYKNLRLKEKAAPATVNRELALMKHAFNMARREWEWVKENPVSMVSMEREPPPRDRWLTREEEAKLLACCPGWLHRMIIFSVETGLRRGELVNLKWSDVQMQVRVIVVFGSKTKERRSVPLSQRAFQVLQVLRRLEETGEFVFVHSATDMRVNVNTLRTAFDSALKRVRINDFHWHDLRHTFASRLAQAGVDPYTIQRLMGHKSFVTTQRYAHHYVDSLRKGIAVLDDPGIIYHNFITIGCNPAEGEMQNARANSK
jgi:integrase